MYIMLMDFCRRSGETHIPEGISPDVYQCMAYIRDHTNYASTGFLQPAA